MYFKRELETFLLKASKQFPVLMVIGPRQVGKTTILRHMSEDDRTYVTLDDPVLADLARNEPALFLQRFKTPILIDEIQYAPQLLQYIKMAVDKNQKAGEFWVTGSQQFSLMNGVSESLAGRVGVLNLIGLSLSEIEQRAFLGYPFLPTAGLLNERLKNYLPKSLNEMYELIWRGSYPALWVKNDEVDRNLFYSSYIGTYIERDVRRLANVGNESAFLKFLRAAAARTGQLLNMSDMARDASISLPTAKRWLSILETSGIIYLLEPYFTNTTKRLVKSPKLYFLDTGLCAYLTEWTTPETLEAGAMSGAMLETFIFTEILKSYWNNGKRPSIYYYRNKDKKEIDLLIIQDGKVYPIEFKKSASVDKNTISNFKLLDQLKLTVAEGAVICFIDTLLPITDNVSAVPVGMI